MTLQQLLTILRARIWITLLVWAITIAAGVGLSLWLPKQFTASTALVIDVKTPDPVTGMMLQGAVAASYMATQMDIINSDRVALNVVKQLNLEKSPAIQQQWQTATGGRGVITDWLAALLKKQLEVRPARESNVITIFYTASEPEFAATVANTFAQTYIDVNLELRVAPAREYATFFTEQTKTARDKLEAAQKALSNYQQQNGITSIDERLDFEVAKLNETSTLLTGQQGQTTDSQSKRGTAQTDTLAEVMQSPLINRLKADISQLEAKLTESNVNLGVNHPQTQRNMAELVTLRNQLQAETRAVKSAIETSYQVSREREVQLKAALATQKARVLALNKQRDELNVLKRDIESAQRAFEQVSQRAAQTSIESRTEQNNIAVLNPAIAPVNPSKPRLLVNLLASIMLGLLFGIGIALLLEISNRKVRSADDLIGALGLPLLGTIANKGARA